MAKDGTVISEGQGVGEQKYASVALAAGLKLLCKGLGTFLDNTFFWLVRSAEHCRWLQYDTISGPDPCFIKHEPVITRLPPLCLC